MSDEYAAFDGQDDDSISTLVDDQLVEATEVTGPCCEKCGAPIVGHESLACRQCGWYASIGSYVEIDKSWEVATDPELADETETGADTTEVPQWAWLLMACVVGVIVESVAARFLTVEGSLARTNWSVTQLFSGFGVFAVCHAIGFALLIKASSETKLLDIFLNPLKGWVLVFRELPKRQWVCHVGLSGLTAAAMSIVVIGGLPYEKLLDWGTKPPPKQSLMAAVMSQAQNMAAEEDDKSLEESVTDLAGKAELDNDKKKKKAKPKPKPRQKEDCVVLGYQTTSDGLIYKLIIGGENYGRLIYTGKVSLSIPVEENRKLAEELLTLKRSRPFVKVPVDHDQATWITPRYVVKVSYARKGKQGGMYDAELEELRGIMEMKK